MRWIWLVNLAAVVVLVSAAVGTGGGCGPTISEDETSTESVVTTNTAQGVQENAVLCGQGTPPCQLCSANGANCVNLATGILGTEINAVMVVGEANPTSIARAIANLTLGNVSNRSVDLVDMTRRAVTTSIAIQGGPNAMDSSGTGRQLAVASATGNAITLINLDTVQIERTIPLTPGTQPTSVCYAKAGDTERLFACGEGGCDMIDNGRSTPLGIGRGQVSCGGDYAVVANPLEGLVFFDPMTGERRDLMALPGVTACYDSEDGECIYCLVPRTPGGCHLVGINVDENREFGRVAIDGTCTLVTGTTTSNTIAVATETSGAGRLTQFTRNLVQTSSQATRVAQSVAFPPLNPATAAAAAGIPPTLPPPRGNR